MAKTDTPLQPNSFGAGLYTLYTSLASGDQIEALPHDIEILNPYRSPATMACVREFCSIFYQDSNPPRSRLSLWGINPGRFGGGITGLSFTDPVVLHTVCGIQTHLGSHRELSAEFIWKAIETYSGGGKQGAKSFFSSFFLTALCPLGFVQRKGDSVVNYNFYDDNAVHTAALPFIIRTMRQQCELGIRRDIAVCLGTGKLSAAFQEINKKHHFFERIVALEHPRFIMQYRRKRLAEYIEKYCSVLGSIES